MKTVEDKREGGLRGARTPVSLEYTNNRQMTNVTAGQEMVKEGGERP